MLNKEKAWQGEQCRAVRAAQGEQGSAGHGAALARLGKAKVQQIQVVLGLKWRNLKRCKLLKSIMDPGVSSGIWDYQNGQGLVIVGHCWCWELIINLNLKLKFAVGG